MTITISASGIALDGPLVAGEKVAVTVSGLSLAAEDKPTLALLARFPDALLASVELAESVQTPGTWTGELDTATKQTALFFATARADERRDAALELVAGRVSLARLTVPMANSALCPKPDGSPFASPVYVPVPGPPGTGCEPYDQAPQMDGKGAAGTATTYARGDHQHPRDTAKVSKSGDTMTNTLVIDGAAAFGLVTNTTFGVAVKKRNTDDYTLYDHGYVALFGSEKGTSRFPRGNLTGDRTTLALQESLATTFSASSTYAVGDYCTHEGLLYKCTTAVSTAGAWNAANWTEVAVTDEMGGKADASALRYSFAAPTPSVSGTTATVACEDRAINDFTIATGITSLTITPPAAVTGRARDFFCRVTLTDSSLPTVTLSGGTIDIGSTDVAGMTQGVNLLMFTEIASGHWLASRRSAS